MKNNTHNDYRPQTYWAHKNPLSEILAGISGKARRAMIRDFWEYDLLDELPPDMLQDVLDEASRKRLGAINPYFMGGEYLPDRLAGEVAIVRIELDSTTHDVIELRARPMAKGKISLRWVDEYDSYFENPIDEIEPIVRLFAQQGNSGHIVQVCDPAEETLPFMGRTRFEGLEGEGATLIGRAEAVRGEYTTLMNAHRDALTDLCRSNGWTFTVHRTDRPVESTLLILHMLLSEMERT